VLEREDVHLSGQVGNGLTHLPNQDSLKVRDPESGTFRYTDGSNDGWDPEGKAAELDRVTKASVGYARGHR